MVTVLNHRQERFCQLIKRGIPPYRAYPMAGYNAHPASPYRLRENARVKRRLAELTRHIAVKTRVTVESLSAELDDAAELARRVEQPGAMVQAVVSKAKLHGLMVERKETGQPGDFAALTTAEEIVAKVRLEAGDAAAQLIADYIAKRTTTETDQGLTTQAPQGNC